MSIRQILILTLFPALLIALLLLGVAGTAQAQSTILYVNRSAAGNNDGSSWTNAFTSLQGALAVANTNPANSYEIWVAKGVYTPGITRTQAFSLTHDNVQIYGGFAATETLRTERDWVANLTVLSGDNDGNDMVDANGIVTTTAHITGTNSYHVLYLDGVNHGPITGRTVIDGFIITAGQANGVPPDSSGGGLFCAGNGNGHACSPSLANLVIIGNAAATAGGGIFNFGVDGGVSSPILSNVILRGNTATAGGGMSNAGDSGGRSNPMLTDVRFFGNTAVAGGGIYNAGRNSGGLSSPILNNVAFIGNVASSNNGGGMFNDGRNGGQSSPILTDVIFTGNAANAGSGGGMYNLGASGLSSPGLTRVTFTSNSAIGGGGMYNNGATGGHSSPILTAVTFISNTAGGGGGIYNHGDAGIASPQLTDVTFAGNAAQVGGGIYNISRSADPHSGKSQPTLTQVRFLNNTAATAGGGMADLSSAGGETRSSLTDVTFINNAAVSGGGMYAIAGPAGLVNPFLTNVTFRGNSASTSIGGGMANGVQGGGVNNPTLTNVLFSGNRAVGGGGMVNDARQGGVISPTLTNVTFSGNRAGTGGGMANLVSNAVIRNTIFWNNQDNSGLGTATASLFNGGATSDIAHSLVQGQNPAGAGNLDGTNPANDPRFVTPVDPATVPTAAGDLRLGAGFPAIDVGNSAALPAGVVTDLDGKPRIVNGAVDLGAYERGGPRSVLYLPSVFR